MDKNEAHSELELYGDQAIASLDAPVPGWLKFSYIFFVIFGIIWFFYFFNGSHGWLDRGYWQELQRAANTTFPSRNLDWPKSAKMEEPYLDEQPK